MNLTKWIAGWIGRGRAVDVEAVKLREQLRRHLGDSGFLRASAWGHLVVGVGRTVQSHLRNHGHGKGIDADLVSEMLERDIKHHHAGVIDRHPWARHLSPPRLAVLIELSFEPGDDWESHCQRMLCSLRDTITGLGSAEVSTAYAVAARYLVTDLPWPTRALSRAEQLANQLRTGEWQ